MHDVKDKHPLDQVLYTVDFTDELPSDTTITTASSITVTDADGVAAPSVILTKSVSGMLLRGVFTGGTLGQDYRAAFTGIGTTTSRPATKMVELRIRDRGLGNL